MRSILCSVGEKDVKCESQNFITYLSGRIHLYPVYFNLQNITIKRIPHARKSIHMRSTQKANHFGYCCCCFTTLTHSKNADFTHHHITFPSFLSHSISLSRSASSSSHITYFRNMCSSSSFNSLVRSFVRPFFPFFAPSPSHFHFCHLFIFQSYSMCSIFNIAK